MNVYSVLCLFLILVGSQAQATNQTSTNGSITAQIANEIPNPPAAPTWLQGSATELASFMSDKYNYFISPNGNKVWVCTMNLAWNEMKRAVFSNNVPTFLNPTALQDKIVSNFNS